MPHHPTAALKFTVRPRPTLTRAWRTVLATLPATRAQERQGEDAIAYVKFFDPCGSWTWFATEATGYTADEHEIAPADFPTREDVAEVVFFGFVQGFEGEWGSFSLRELAAIDGRMQIGIERDCWFTPAPVSKLVAVTR